MWTVGPLTAMNLWSHVSAIHIVIALTAESCEGVTCDGCVDIRKKKRVNSPAPS